MKDKKTAISFFHMGAPSLLIIFLILCLVTFALLSLSSAKNNLTLSQQSANRIAQYYEASSCAEEVLSSIDKILSESFDASDQQLDLYFEKAEHAFRSFQSVPITTDFSKTEEQLSFAVPINDSQQLTIVLTILSPTPAADGFYTIDQWTVENTDIWEGDDQYQLLLP